MAHRKNVSSMGNADLTKLRTLSLPRCDAYARLLMSPLPCSYLNGRTLHFQLRPPQLNNNNTNVNMPLPKNLRLKALDDTHPAATELFEDTVVGNYFSRQMDNPPRKRMLRRPTDQVKLSRMWVLAESASTRMRVEIVCF